MKLIPAFFRCRIEHRPNLVKIVDNIGWLFLDKVLRMGVGLLIGVWVARYLGPEQFGLLGYAIAVCGLFGVVADLGLQSIVVRDIVRNPDGMEETLGTAAVILIIGSIIAYSLTLGAIFYLRPDDSLAKALVAILGSIMLFKVSEISAYWFESQVLSKYTVWVHNGSFLIFVLVRVVLLLKNAPLIAFAWAMMAEAFVVALLMSRILSLRGPSLGQLRVNLLRAKTLLKDSWPLFLSGMAIVIYMKIDQIMLGQMVGNEAVGIYGSAVRISEVWYFIPMVIVASVFPAILEAKKKSESLYYGRLQRLYDLMVWISVSIALPMTFLSEPLVVLLLGEAYASAGSVLSIHIWGAVFVFLGVASGQWILAENLQILSFQRSFLGAVINVILNLILIPIYGVIGAATATVMSQAVAGLFFDCVQPVTRKMFFMKLKTINIFRIFNNNRS